MRVAKSGGFPCRSSATLKICAANQMAQQAAASEIPIVDQTCQAGGGALALTSRASIANVFTGGTKLRTMLKVESGAVASLLLRTKKAEPVEQRRATGDAVGGDMRSSVFLGHAWAV
jgi:hypothetical protein